MEGEAKSAHIESLHDGLGFEVGVETARAESVHSSALFDGSFFDVGVETAKDVKPRTLSLHDETALGTFDGDRLVVLNAGRSLCDGTPLYVDSEAESIDAVIRDGGIEQDGDEEEILYICMYIPYVCVCVCVCGDEKIFQNCIQNFKFDFNKNQVIPGSLT